MSFLEAAGRDLKGGRREAVRKVGHEAFVCPAVCPAPVASTRNRSILSQVNTNIFHIRKTHGDSGTGVGVGIMP